MLLKGVKIKECFGIKALVNKIVYSHGGRVGNVVQFNVIVRMFKQVIAHFLAEFEAVFGGELEESGRGFFGEFESGVHGGGLKVCL